MVFDAVSRHESGMLSLDTFIDHMAQAINQLPTPGSQTVPGTSGTRLPTMKQAIELLIAEALHRTDGNQSAAADLIDVSRQTISRYCRKKTNEPIA